MTNFINLYGFRLVKIIGLLVFNCLMCWFAFFEFENFKTGYEKTHGGVHLTFWEAVALAGSRGGD